jgi:hypothetical protein
MKNFSVVSNGNLGLDELNGLFYGVRRLSHVEYPPIRFMVKDGGGHLIRAHLESIKSMARLDPGAITVTGTVAFTESQDTSVKSCTIVLCRNTGEGWLIVI